MESAKKTTIINLVGGPGVGKSTAAAFIFAQLKEAGYSVEMVREIAKDWVWEGRSLKENAQLPLLGMQAHAEQILYGQVDYIITDSPLFLFHHYVNQFSSIHMAAAIHATVTAFYHDAAVAGHTHHMVKLSRFHPYVPSGRYQTEVEALKIDDALEKALDTYWTGYRTASYPFGKDLRRTLDLICNTRRFSSAA